MEDTKQSRYSRRMQSEVAEIGSIPPVVMAGETDTATVVIDPEDDFTVVTDAKDDIFDDATEVDDTAEVDSAAIAIPAKPKPVSVEFVALRQKLQNDSAAELEIFRVPGLNADGNHSPELVAEIDEWSQQLAAVQAAARNATRQISDAINSAAGDGNFGSLIASAEICRVDRADALGKFLTLLKAGVVLARRAAAELSPVVQAAEQAKESVVQAVKDDLTRIGQGVNSTQAGRSGYNPAAAERQFNHYAEQNERSQAAIAKATALKAAAGRYTEMANAYQHRLPEVEKALGKLVSRMIA